MTETKSRLIAFALFVGTCIAVFACEKYFRLSHAAYWVDHAFFGFGFTLFIFAGFGSYRIASVSTFVWSFGNELFQDHFDRLETNPNTPYFVQWDHLGGDMLGFFFATLVFFLALRVRSLDNPLHG